MDTIEVTFPKHIPINKVIFNLEGNIKHNSKYTCKVVYDRYENGENTFLVSSKFGAPAFFLIGMTASAIIERFCK